MPENPMVRMQELLRELFQFDCQDLDFGVYRVLNYRRKQVEEFIGERLPQVVDEAFAQYAAADKAAVDRELEEKRHEIVASLGATAFDATGQLVMAFRETPLGKLYIELEHKAKVGHVAEELKAGVYNDLYTFFSRYYEDGDVFSKPRRGKVEIPFTGHEDVVLHWANKDQYYIKTGEQFKTYRFAVDKQAVQFALKNAATEQNNNQREKRYFVLVEESPVAFDDKAKTMTVFFEYRPLTNAEKKSFGKTENQKPQDKLNAVAEEASLKRVKDATLKARLAQPVGDGKPGLLRYHLNRFTKKNSTDFFIHKNLRGFLERELADFLKTEVLRVDELLATGGTVAAQQLARGRVVREIAGQIIAFLAQIEDFQKKLFEKRKFVVRTEYCVTLDRLPEPLWADVLKNEAQLAEWRELYAITKKKPDKAFLKAHDKLVVDTRHFPESFKWQLLASFDDLDAALDGLLIKSENFQALALLLAKYRERVNCIYIDPPYNAAETEILYKNEYKHSSWLALMADRVLQANRLLSADGAMCVTIDDYELHRLRFLLDEIFSPENSLASVVIRNNPSGRSTVSGFAINHEYGLFYAKSDAVAIGRLPHTDEQRERYDQTDENGKKFEWENFRKSSRGSNRGDRPKQFFPIFYNEKTNAARIPHVEWQEEKKSWRVTESPKANEVVILPIDGHKVEKVWNYGIDRTKAEIGKMLFEKTGEKYEVYKRKPLHEEGSLPRTWWDSPLYSARDNGTRALKDILGPTNAFDFPKAVRAVEDSVRICSPSDNAIAFDFFAGSGTTGHAIINLNREDDGSRKYVLVEAGGWFDTALLPRLKKLAFCSEWSDGKPSGGKGVSHLLKYQLLEQYDDTLNNLALPRAKEGELALKQFGDEYLLRYMLDFETAGSASLLAVEQLRHPFNYRLKVQEGDEIAERPVDLVETFNYLLGLHVKKLREVRDGKRPYRVTLGEARNGKSVVVVWRDTEGLESSTEALQRDRQFVEGEILPALLGKNVKPDRLMVNQPYAGEADPIEPEFKRLMFAPIG